MMHEPNLTNEQQLFYPLASPSASALRSSRCETMILILLAPDTLAVLPIMGAFRWSWSAGEYG